jgi:hypothetical protein
MRKIISAFLVSSFALSANAVSVVPSLNEINLSSDASSVTVKYSLSDTISKLHGKEGFLKAKLKLSNKLFTTDLPKKTIYIPYSTDGISANSLPFSVSLKEGEEIATGTYDYKVVFPKKAKKKFGLTDFTGEINVTSSETQNLIKGFARTINSSVTSSSIASFSSEGLEGKPVELHTMDSLGNVNPEVISQTTVAADGSYELPLPAGENAGINYIVQVKEVDSDGDNLPDSTLESLVYEKNTEITPWSDFVADKVKDALGSSQAEFQNVSNEEIKDLVEDPQKINIVGGDTIEETQDKYNEKLGPFFSSSITNIDDEQAIDSPFNFDEDFDIKDFNPGDIVFQGGETGAGAIANDVAGRYFFAGYSNIVSNNHHGVVSEIGEAFLAKPSETGIINTILAPNLRSEALLNTTGSSLITEGDEPMPSPSCFQLQIATDRNLARPVFSEDKDLGFAFSIDENKVIIAISPENTSINEVPGPRTIQFTSSSFVTDFLPAGEGMFIGTTFKLGSGIDVDTGAPDIQEYQQGYSTLVKNADFNADLDPVKGKSYAIVGISHTMTGTGNEGLRSSYGSIDFAEDINVTVNFNHNEVRRDVATTENTCGPIAIASSSSNETVSGVRNYDDRGKLVLLDADEFSVSPRRRFSQLEGYIRPDAKLITLAAFSDLNIEGTAIRPGSIGDTVFDEAQVSKRDFYFATEILQAFPNITGESYEMISYRAELDSDGNLTNYMPVSGSRDTLTFSGSTVSISYGTQNIIQGKAFGNFPTATTNTPSSSGSVAAISGAKAGNSLEFTIDGENYIGYVTEDGKQIIMTSYSTSSVAIHFLVNTDFLVANQGEGDK